MATTPTTTARSTITFPAHAVADRLRRALTQLQADTAAIREAWDPEFDSLAVVNILLFINDVIPGLPLAPEKIVRKGGYATLDDAVHHILAGVERAWRKWQTRSS